MGPADDHPRKDWVKETWCWSYHAAASCQPRPKCYECPVIDLCPLSEEDEDPAARAIRRARRDQRREIDRDHDDAVRQHIRRVGAAGTGPSASIADPRHANHGTGKVYRGLAHSRNEAAQPDTDEVAAMPGMGATSVRAMTTTITRQRTGEDARQRGWKGSSFVSEESR